MVLGYRTVRQAVDTPGNALQLPRGHQPSEHLPVDPCRREIAGGCALAPSGESQRLLMGGASHVSKCRQLFITVNVLAHGVRLWRK
jgi:hypothetical protein